MRQVSDADILASVTDDHIQRLIEDLKRAQRRVDQLAENLADAEIDLETAKESIKAWIDDVRAENGWIK